MESRRGEVCFLADWVDMVFLHFEVDPGKLQSLTPFPIDRFQGQAFASLVAFTMKRMRFRRGGAFTRWITEPIASHEFLNLRTYVCPPGRTGILFLSEWVNHRLAAALGPRTFGLPYRHAAISYSREDRESTGIIETDEGLLRFVAESEEPVTRAEPATREEFLLERYTAFTEAGYRRQFFRVWHPAWQFQSLTRVDWSERSLIDRTADGLLADAKYVGGQLSAGMTDVWMGRPHLARI